MAEKANHHFVPQFYLRHFAQGVGRKAKVTAFEAATGKSFVTAVRNVGAERHFNRINVDGHDPNALEDAVAQIEAHWAPHVAETVAAGAFPSDEHRESVLMMVATLALRSGSFRKTIQDATDKVIRMMIEANLSSEERWREADPDGEVSYEKIKELWDNKAIDLTFEQTYFIGHELHAIAPVYDLLSKRNWCFVRAGAANRFITSDSPAVLEWTIPDERRDMLYSPGFGVPETSVIFALSSDVALLGQFEPNLPEIEFRDTQVAQMNGLIARHARRQFYARDTLFQILTKHGIQPASKLVEVMRRRSTA